MLFTVLKKFLFTFTRFLILYNLIFIFTKYRKVSLSRYSINRANIEIWNLMQKYISFFKFYPINQIIEFIV